jgi:hypothetical protein
LKILLSKEKNTQEPRMPDTAKKVQQTHLEDDEMCNLGVDMDLGMSPGKESRKNLFHSLLQDS